MGIGKHHAKPVSLCAWPSLRWAPADFCESIATPVPRVGLPLGGLLIGALTGIPNVVAGNGSDGPHTVADLGFNDPLTYFTAVGLVMPGPTVHLLVAL